jgi:hypothetical protein
MAIPVGDTNGDGYADAIRGSSCAPYDADGGCGPGRAYVYSGSSASGLVAPVTLVGPDTPGAQFGTVVGGADLNGDGYSDVFVVAPGETYAADSQVGTISIYLGASTGTATTPAARLPLPY